MEEIYDDNRKRRIVIFRRDDGHWSFVEEYFSEREFEMCWIPVRGSISICDTRETALREARISVDWLIELK